MRTLKESILSDMEDTLSIGNDDVKNIINGDVPTHKDFKVLYNVARGVMWKCPILVKKLAKDVEKRMHDFNHDYKAENIIGICCLYRDALAKGYRKISLYLYDKKYQPYHIFGIGGTTEQINAKAAEYLIMKFIELVCNNHNILDYIAHIHNTAQISSEDYFVNFVKKLESL